ncbi:hypothetical protein QQZ08_004884 [Neonectria magnoliae]|uniref:Uncharacterized protein n=1 Tax=Neonectria magnoliae TaxID=2732573 RepID=A0ABR1I4Z7_9HYPO
MTSQISREAPSSHSSYSSYASFATNSGKGRRRRLLDQLTKLLWMHPDVDLANPQSPWLMNQEARIKKLDGSLQRQKNIFNRLAARIDKHRHPGKSAHLCPSHRGLNPRVIRHFMLMLATEFTQRTDRFRTWRARMTFSDSLIAWLDRMDSATALWIGRDAFHFVFGYDCPAQDIMPVDSQCEACIMAVIGGRPSLLSDLRANMVARESQYPKKRRMRPRLWSLVDSWISHFDTDTRESIFQMSNDLGAEIAALNDDIRRQKEKNSKTRAESGKPPKERRRERSKRAGKLPEPRQPDSRRWSQYSDYADYSFMDEPTTEQTVDNDRVPILRAEPSIALDNGNVFSDQQGYEDEEDEAVGHENWEWLENRMRKRELTTQQSHQAMRGIHPALSEYGPAASARVPSNVDQEPSRRSSWMTMTVQTEVEEFQMNAEPGRPQSCIESEEIYAATPRQGQYVPARAHWTNTGSTQQQQQQQSFPIPPPSSVYSSHPGFRRGVNGSVIYRDPFAHGGRRPACAPSSAVSSRADPNFDWKAENRKYPEWI